jgi:hypothetical protein
MIAGFAYRIKPETMVYLAAAGVLVTVTIVTIGCQSLKAAFRNPVLSIRYE